jgi:protein-S-isoprenylcysteine O-methyltransferase
MTIPLLPTMGMAFLVSELILARSRRSEATQANARDRGSLRLLWIVIGAAITAGMSFADSSPRLPAGVPWAMIGLGVSGLGAVLRWWAIWHLGRFFTVDVAVAHDHRVVDDGPYRYVRHPSYSGLLLEFLGLSLVPGALWTVFIILIPTFVALWYRIQVEEEALGAALGPAYADYKRRTTRLIPGIF